MIIETALLKPVRDAGLPTPRFTTRKQRIGKKMRMVSKPNGAMRAVQWGLSDYLLERLQPALESWLGPQALEVSTAFWPGSSCARNAGQHVLNRFILTTDLKDAYASVPGEALAPILAKLDPELHLREGELLEEMRVEGLREFLRRYCLTPQGGLCFGGPASPHLFNLYLGWVLDGVLIQIMNEERIDVTRYADDITFGSRHHLSHAKRRDLLAAIRGSGMQINERKVCYRDMAREAVSITGVRLQWQGPERPARLSAERGLFDRLESLLRAYVAGRVVDDYEVAEIISGLWATVIALGGGTGVRWQRITSLFAKFKERRYTPLYESATTDEKKVVTLWNGRAVKVDPRP